MFLLVASFMHVSKSTHRENTSSNKTEAPTESINVDIWAISTLNQLFTRTLKKTFVVLTLAFDREGLYGNGAASFLVFWIKKKVI